MAEVNESPVAERMLVTRSGYSFTVRPAEEQDEEALEAFFSHVSPEDLRFRFLTAVGHVPHAMIEAMSHVNHKTTENFLAVDSDGSVVGSAMVAADEKLERAEVAIEVQNNGLLPLDATQLRRIAVVGPNADDDLQQLGDWTLGASQHPPEAGKQPREKTTTVLDGIRALAPNGLAVRYERGCSIINDDLSGIPAAVAAAQAADVVVAVLRRYGRELDPSVEVRGPSLALDGAHTLVRIRHLARYDVIARDFLLLLQPEGAPLVELATSVAGALVHLAEAAARRG